MDMPPVVNMLREADSVRLDLAITPGLDAFHGHFDGAPLVPGVVQIHWALRFANQYLAPISPLLIDRMDAVKFQQVMQPGAEVCLQLALVGNSLSFVYSSGSTRYSSGKIPVNL